MIQRIFWVCLETYIDVVFGEISELVDAEQARASNVSGRVGVLEAKALPHVVLEITLKHFFDIRMLSSADVCLAAR